VWLTGLLGTEENWHRCGQGLCHESVEEGEWDGWAVLVARVMSGSVMSVCCCSQASIVRSKKDTIHTKAERHILEAVKVNNFIMC